ncbi:MAG: PIN domain-containing protein, partial [Bacteroidota bacterium]
NAFLVSIPRKSKYRKVFDAIIDGKINIVITNEILNEYTEVIERKSNRIAGRVKFVVTNDKHFNILKNIPFPKVEIITIQDFLEELNML